MAGVLVLHKNCTRLASRPGNGPRIIWPGRLQAVSEGTWLKSVRALVEQLDK